MSLMGRTIEQHIHSPLHWVLCTATCAGDGKKKMPFPFPVFHPVCLDLKVSSVHITCSIFFVRQTHFLQTLAEAQNTPGSIQSPHICHTPATRVHQGGPKRGMQPHRAEELCVRKLGLTLGLCSSVPCCVSSRVIFKCCFMGIVLSWLESRYAALICLKKQ